MDSVSFAQVSSCPECGDPVSAEGRWERCKPIADATTASSSWGRAFEPARARGAGASQRIRAAWAVHDARVPLVALTATLIGSFLPWLSGISAIQLLGWHLPILATLLVAMSTVAFLTTPSRPTWLAFTAAGASFLIAVSASLLLVILLVLTHAIADLQNALADFGSSTSSAAGAAHISVGVGAWVTAASATVLFISVFRLGLITRSEE